MVFLSPSSSIPIEKKQIHNAIALRKAKIAYNFGGPKCNRVKVYLYCDMYCIVIQVLGCVSCGEMNVSLQP